MNPGHLRLQVPRDEGLLRLRRWIARPEAEPPQECSAIDAVRLATHDMKHWKGIAIFVGEVDGWTVFEDLVGALESTDAEDLLHFAGAQRLVLAAYNDAVCSARLVVVEGGRVAKDFSHDPDNPEHCWNRGHLEDEAEEPIQSWLDVASRMDDREIDFGIDKGTLLIFAHASK